MSRLTNSRSDAAGLLGALALLIGLGGCAGASARSQYYSSRAIVHEARPGDGSVSALGPGAGERVWTASLTLVPLDDSGDLASAD